MRSTPRLCWLLAVVAPALAAALLPAQTGRGKATQYAFLVACSGYDKTELRPLPYVINDIEGFREALLATGFDGEHIKLLHDKRTERRYQSEKAKILRELNLLLDGLKEEDTVVVALSGHGVHFKGDKTGYFCPVDAKLADKKTLLPMEGAGGLFELLKSCKARKKLLIVNACRNDPAADLAQAANKINLDDEDKDEVPEGIAALYSCKQGQKSYFDPDRQRGIFFDHVIRAWKGEYQKDGEVKLEDFFQAVVTKTKTDVDKTLGEAQVPVVRRQYSGNWLIGAARRAKGKTEEPAEPQKPNQVKITTSTSGYVDSDQRDIHSDWKVIRVGTPATIIDTDDKKAMYHLRFEDGSDAWVRQDCCSKPSK